MEQLQDLLRSCKQLGDARKAVARSPTAKMVGRACRDSRVHATSWCSSFRSHMQRGFTKGEASFEYLTGLLLIAVVLLMLWVLVISGVGGGGRAADKYLEYKMQAVDHRLKEAEAKLQSLPQASGLAELKTKVAGLHDRVEALVDRTDRALSGFRGRPVVTPAHLKEEIDVFAADRTGLADYALYQEGVLWGARVVGHSPASSHMAWGGVLKAMSRPITGIHEKASEYLLTAGPEVPGHCLALKGSEGWVDVQLRAPVVPTAVSVEHLSRSYAYDFGSAPRRFSVEGWQQSGVLGRFVRRGVHAYGEFEYSGEGRAVQTFELPTGPGAAAVSHVRLRVRSNHGREDYTCLYRLRVHGRPTGDEVA